MTTECKHAFGCSTAQVIEKLILKEFRLIRMEIKNEMKQLGNKLGAMLSQSVDNNEVMTSQSVDNNEVMTSQSVDNNEVDLIDIKEEILEGGRVLSEKRHRMNRNEIYMVGGTEIDELEGLASFSLSEDAQDGIEKSKIQGNVNDPIMQFRESSQVDNPIKISTDDIGIVLPFSLFGELKCSNQTLQAPTSIGTYSIATENLGHPLDLTDADTCKPSRKKKKYNCKICGKLFKRKRALKGHACSISKNKKIIFCKFCQRCFDRKSTCRKHERLHTGDRPYHCGMPTCEKAFRTKAAFLTHISTHGGRKSSKCKAYGKDYKE